MLNTAAKLFVWAMQQENKTPIVRVLPELP